MLFSIALEGDPLAPSRISLFAEGAQGAPARCLGDWRVGAGGGETLGERVAALNAAIRREAAPGDTLGTAVLFDAAEYPPLARAGLDPDLSMASFRDLDAVARGVWDVGRASWQARPLELAARERGLEPPPGPLGAPWRARAMAEAFRGLAKDFDACPRDAAGPAGALAAVFPGRDAPVPIPATPRMLAAAEGLALARSQAHAGGAEAAERHVSARSELEAATLEAMASVSSALAGAEAPKEVRSRTGRLTLAAADRDAVAEALFRFSRMLDRTAAPYEMGRMPEAAERVDAAERVLQGVRRLRGELSRAAGRAESSGRAQDPLAARISEDAMGLSSVTRAAMAAVDEAEEPPSEIAGSPAYLADLQAAADEAREAMGKTRRELGGALTWGERRAAREQAFRAAVARIASQAPAGSDPEGYAWGRVEAARRADYERQGSVAYEEGPRGRTLLTSGWGFSEDDYQDTVWDLDLLGEEPATAWDAFLDEVAATSLDAAEAARIASKAAARARAAAVPDPLRERDADARRDRRRAERAELADLSADRDPALRAGTVPSEEPVEGYAPFTSPSLTPEQLLVASDGLTERLVKGRYDLWRALGGREVERLVDDEYSSRGGVYSGTPYYEPPRRARAEAPQDAPAEAAALGPEAAALAAEVVAEAIARKGTADTDFGEALKAAAPVLMSMGVEVGSLSRADFDALVDAVDDAVDAALFPEAAPDHLPARRERGEDPAPAPREREAWRYSTLDVVTYGAAALPTREALRAEQAASAQALAEFAAASRDALGKASAALSLAQSQGRGRKEALSALKGLHRVLSNALGQYDRAVSGWRGSLCALAAASPDREAAAAAVRGAEGLRAGVESAAARYAELARDVPRALSEVRYAQRSSLRAMDGALRAMEEASRGLPEALEGAARAVRAFPEPTFTSDPRLAVARGAGFGSRARSAMGAAATYRDYERGAEPAVRDALLAARVPDPAATPAEKAREAAALARAAALNPETILNAYDPALAAAALVGAGLGGERLATARAWRAWGRSVEADAADAVDAAFRAGEWACCLMADGTVETLYAPARAGGPLEGPEVGVAEELAALSGVAGAAVEAASSAFEARGEGGRVERAAFAPASGSRRDVEAAACAAAARASVANAGGSPMGNAFDAARAEALAGAYGAVLGLAPDGSHPALEALFEENPELSPADAAHLPEAARQASELGRMLGRPDPNASAPSEVWVVSPQGLAKAFASRARPAVEPPRAPEHVELRGPVAPARRAAPAPHRPAAPARPGRDLVSAQVVRVSDLPRILALAGAMSTDPGLRPASASFERDLGAVCRMWPEATEVHTCSGWSAMGYRVAVRGSSGPEPAVVGEGAARELFYDRSQVEPVPGAPSPDAGRVAAAVLAAAGVEACASWDGAAHLTRSGASFSLAVPEGMEGEELARAACRAAGALAVRSRAPVAPGPSARLEEAAMFEAAARVVAAAVGVDMGEARMAAAGAWIGEAGVRPWDLALEAASAAMPTAAVARRGLLGEAAGPGEVPRANYSQAARAHEAVWARETMTMRRGR